MKKIGLDITVLNDAEKTGIGVYTQELLTSLIRQNDYDEFTLFGFTTMSSYKSVKKSKIAQFPNVRLKLIKLPAKLFRASFLLWQFLNWPSINNVIRDLDIFHSFNYYLPPQTRGKNIATVFDTTPISHPEWHQDRTVQLDNIRLKRIKENADLVIAISENTKRDFLEYSPNSRVEVIYPATKAYKQVVTKNELMRKFHIKGEYLLSVSTLEPRKNLLRLVKAFLQISTDKTLVLVGASGWNNNELMKLVRQNSKKITLLGYVTDGDLAGLYKYALCLVYPSLYEGFGIPVLEAMSFGTPVITSKTSSLPEVGGNAVLYIDPLDIKDLQNKIYSVLLQKQLRKDLSARGLVRARKFSWDKSAKKLNSIYQSF
ncbi:MAG: glycosyltransferase family 4 protein [Patescibacteria group bacterium]|nr:glycosyltransferase family 4 protein [Patescibacteria group bacterium]